MRTQVSWLEIKRDSPYCASFMQYKAPSSRYFHCAWQLTALCCAEHIFAFSDQQINTDRGLPSVECKEKSDFRAVVFKFRRTASRLPFALAPLPGWKDPQWLRSVISEGRRRRVIMFCFLRKERAILCDPRLVSACALHPYITWQLLTSAQPSISAHIVN